MNGNMIVALVTIVASLFLAVRALRSRQLDFSRTALMAGVWVVIIAALAFVLQRFAA
ncbi:MAG TPA: hypothetical protein VF481_12100 [Novosphingobium sp.]